MFQVIGDSFEDWIKKLNYELLQLTSTEDCQLPVLLSLSCIFHDNHFAVMFD